MVLCLRWPLLACCVSQAHPRLTLGKMLSQIALRTTSPAASVPRRLDRQMPFLIPDTHTVVRCTACHTYEEHLVLHDLGPASVHQLHCATPCKTT